MVVTQERVIDWLERQIGFVKANHLENCLMTNDGDLKMEPDNPNLCTLVIYDPRLPAIV